MQGKLIVVEGIDKSGKSTQGKMLVDFLNSKGHETVFCSEPTYENPVGLLIRDWLNGKVEIESGETIAMLYTADRYEDLKTRALPALESGKNVVMDRYVLSTIVYQSVLYGVPVEWIKELNKFARKPDLTIFIDIPAEESIRRAGKSADRHEKLEKMEKVREGYLRFEKDKNFFVVDGNRSVDAVFEDVKEAVKNLR
ncbi:MAG: dTMP kinase [Candidatus Aenigmarchaeota archaeon]|nr:dTMP kinase [Candidatus Aenigmarchaeota archaeon]